MNSAAKGFLGTAIAILVPVVIFYGVVTALPKPDSTSLTPPTAPPPFTCQSVGEGESPKLRARPNANVNCVAQRREYEARMNRYQADLKAYEARVAAQTQEAQNVEHNRALLAFSLSLAAILLAAFLRSMPALMAGLVGGAAIGVVIAGIQLASADVEGTRERLGSLAILIGFIVLTALVALAERALKESPDKKGSEDAGAAVSAGAPFPSSTGAPAIKSDEPASAPIEERDKPGTSGDERGGATEKEPEQKPGQ